MKTKRTLYKITSCGPINQYRYIRECERLSQLRIKIEITVNHSLHLLKTAYENVCMYVCMYVCFFISQPQQHKSKHKNTIKAEKKEAAKKRYTL